MHNICGIDPGLSGGVAILDANGNPLYAAPLKTIEHGKRPLVAARDLKQTLERWSVVHTTIENVATRPGQGGASQGAFMRAIGTVYGVADIQGAVTWVTPTQWKRFHDLLKKDKEASRAAALKLWPDHAHLFTPKRLALTKKQAQDVAEAALIARWYFETRGKKVRKLLPAQNHLLVRA